MELVSKKDKEKMAELTGDAAVETESGKKKMAELTEDTALGEVASEKIFEADPELARELAEDRKIQEKAREYKELQEARKQVKRKRIIIALFAVVIVCACVFLGVRFYQKKQAEAAAINEVSITEGQELVYAQITSIVGNNITVSRINEDTFQATGETTDLQIPVGTEVISKLGTTVTFSSLSADDYVAIALEAGTDIIDKMWIVEYTQTNGSDKGNPFEGDSENPFGGEMQMPSGNQLKRSIKNEHD